jgi:hypothetical protein
MSVNGASLSDDLRTERPNRYLAKRRQIVALAATGAACMTAVALYQIGAVRRLPELPVAAADSARIVGSPQAYTHLSIGDGFLGALSYTVTMLLAGVGSSQRHRRARALPLALAAKATLDAVAAARLTWDEVTKYRGFCTPCVVAAVTTAITLPLAWPEARAAMTKGL